MDKKDVKELVDAMGTFSNVEFAMNQLSMMTDATQMLAEALECTKYKDIAEKFSDDAFALSREVQTLYWNLKTVLRKYLEENGIE